MLNLITRSLTPCLLATLIGTTLPLKNSWGEPPTVKDGSTAMKSVVQMNTDFAIDLYKQLAQDYEGENLFFSPFSVLGTLTITAEGAREETAVEIGTVLRFPDAAQRVGDDAVQIPWDTSRIHAGMEELSDKLNNRDEDPVETAEIRAKIGRLREQIETTKQGMDLLRKDRKWRDLMAAEREQQIVIAELHKLASQIDQYEIRLANALWGEKTYPFDPVFVKTINRYYEAGGMFTVDFRNAFEEARLTINSWVEEQTNGRIKVLITSGALNEYTRLVLTNAVYFKGEWSVPFEEANTKDRDFTLATGEKTTTPTMHAQKLDVVRYGAFNADGSLFNTPMRIQHGQDLKQLYPKMDGFAMVELPYKGDDLSMVVIVPINPTGLAMIEKRLTSGNLEQWIAQLNRRDAHVYLPKFKMETKYALGDAESPGTLQRMGMVRAFQDPRDPNAGAQFPAMTTSTNTMEQLYISKVFHKAFVEVNEKGTEAAAATAVLMVHTTSAPLDVPFTPEFKADRPFIFLIREKSTGTVIFFGRMTEPTTN